MNIQNTIVLILVLISVVYIIYRQVIVKKKGRSPCDYCSTGCELHTMMMKKERECKQNAKKTRKD